jgi:hypothetical protein
LGKSSHEPGKSFDEPDKVPDEPASHPGDGFAQKRVPRSRGKPAGRLGQPFYGWFTAR